MEVFHNRYVNSLNMSIAKFRVRCMD